MVAVRVLDCLAMLKSLSGLPSKPFEVQLRYSNGTQAEFVASLVRASLKIYLEAVCVSRFRSLQPKRLKLVEC